MQVKNFARRRLLCSALAALLSAITFAGSAGAQQSEEGTVRTTQQALVNGAVVTPEEQERYGLVTLSTGCSGSLLRNNWVLTAAHCVEDDDPLNPGRFTLAREDSITLTANWKTMQVRKSTRIISFGQNVNDVAIIRFDTPFFGRKEGYNREVFRDAAKSVKVMAFGRGLNVFAQGSGATATPTQADGQYRVGYFAIDKVTGATYGLPSGSQSMGGGDSGGPSYVQTPAGDLIAGVHSSCGFTCLPGKTCAAPTVWMWVSATPRCSDASVAPVWDEINGYLGAYVPPRYGSNDFNDDGRGDILWYNASTGEAQVWFMNGSSRVGRANVMDGARPTRIGPPWEIVGSRDFNGDGKADLLWHNASTGETQIWHLDGYKFVGRATVLGEDGRPALVGLPWSIVGTNDMDGDKKTDIVWHNASTGETQIWHMNGHKVRSRATVLGPDGKAAFVGLPWSTVGTNDFNSDGKPDLLWHNASTGEIQIWHVDDYKVSGRATVVGENGRPAFVGPPWRIAGTNDFNQDGRGDILWHNGSTGETQMWFMNGYTVVRRTTVDAALDGGGDKVGPPWSIMNH